MTEVAGKTECLSCPDWTERCAHIDGWILQLNGGDTVGPWGVYLLAADAPAGIGRPGAKQFAENPYWGYGRDDALAAFYAAEERLLAE